MKLSMISGDDNGIALIHIGASGGMLNAESYLIEGVKAEKHTPGKQNDVILLENMNGSPVVILEWGRRIRPAKKRMRLCEWRELQRGYSTSD